MSTSRSSAHAGRLVALTLVLAASLASRPSFGESVTVSVPALLAFQVYDVHSSTPSSPSRVTVSFSGANVTLGNYLRVSVTADAASFSTPGGGVAIPASALSWTTSSAVGGTGSSGTLDSGAETTVFDSVVNPTAGSVDMAWTLSSLPTGVYAGDHELTVRYRFESLF